MDDRNVAFAVIVGQVVAGDLALLVVADLSSQARLLTYDISDCARPRPLGSFQMPQPVQLYRLSAPDLSQT